MKRIAIVILSRANYARIKTLLTELENSESIQLQIIVGGSLIMSEKGSGVEILARDGFTVSQSIDISPIDNSLGAMAKFTGMLIIRMVEVFQSLKPDVVLTIADRYETLATAIAASYMNITLAHTQGGELTGSIDEPVRHAISRFANLHFPATKAGAKILKLSGENPKSIYCVGCPSLDFLEVAKNVDIEEIKLQLGIDTNNYFIYMQHPVTSENSDIKYIANECCKAIKMISRTYKGKCIYLCPNIDPGSEILEDEMKALVKSDAEVSRMIIKKQNFSPEDYASLLNNADLILGNSSSGIREASFLGVPCVNIGSRQNKRQRGPNVNDVNYNSSDILKSFLTQLAHGRYTPSTIYGDGKASAKIAKILRSYMPTKQKSLSFDIEEIYSKIVN